MPLDTFERSTPRLFNRGPTPLVRLLLATTLGIFLMVADSRFGIGSTARSVTATVLAPLQWLGAQPVKTVNLLGTYVTTVETAKQTQEQAATLMAQQALKAQRADLLMRENQSLRELLSLEQALPIQARAAEVVYIAPDPFTRRVVINKGSSAGIVEGAPVIDASGLLGQVLRVYPLSSEVTLIDNPEHATPIINSRTGERGLAYGDSQSPQASALEVRFMASNADFKVGDVLTTSGLGGVYPAGLPVGTVSLVDRRSNTSFTRVQATPAAKPLALGYVLVLEPQEQVKSEAAASAASAAAAAKADRKAGAAGRNRPGVKQ
jgi:rod shape-determining protein MreC